MRKQLPDAQWKRIEDLLPGKVDDPERSGQDNRLFVERPWKSVKYEHVYLHAYESHAEARQQLARYFTFYDSHRLHSSLGGMTPDTAYFGKLGIKHAA